MVWAPALILAGQAMAVTLQHQVPMPSTRPITAAERSAIARAVSDQLRDPEDARFRWTPNIGANGRYCGLVNGQNGYGGYAGYRPFQVSVARAPDGAIMVRDVTIGLNPDFAEAITSGCSMAGLDLQKAEPN